PVDPDADEAALPHVLEEVLELALPAADQGRQNLDPAALLPGEHGIGNLRGALPADGAPVIGAVRRAGTGPEQTEVVVDLGDGSDGGAGILAGALLFD